MAHSIILWSRSYKCFAKEWGKDEIPYVEAFMLLRQEEKGQRTATLWCSNQKENLRVSYSTMRWGRKWEWGRIISKLKPPSSSLSSSPNGWTGCTCSCSNCPPMPPTYSPPPVSPTHGDQTVVSTLTPGAQEPGLVSPSKNQHSTQFGPGATSTAGQFP